MSKVKTLFLAVLITFGFARQANAWSWGGALQSGLNYAAKGLSTVSKFISENSYHTSLVCATAVFCAGVIWWDKKLARDEQKCKKDSKTKKVSFDQDNLKRNQKDSIQRTKARADEQIAKSRLLLEQSERILNARWVWREWRFVPTYRN